MRALTSASNLFRRELCPGSALMEQGLPDEDSNQAEEGIVLHKLTADPTIDRTDLPQNLQDLLQVSEELTKSAIEQVEQALDL